VTDPSGDATGTVAEPPPGRDRVLDAVRVSALGVVVLGHALAWDVVAGTPGSVTDRVPGLAWTTWVVQVLPLFFAVGALGNLGSLRRHPDLAVYGRRRLLRLGTPALVFALVWTGLLLPLAAAFPLAELAGDVLGQLTWFLGVYAVAVLATPWTSRGAQRRPLLTLAVWFGAIVLVDGVRFTVTPVVGWLNLLLVWGWLHQLGFHLPALRRWPTTRLLTLAGTSLAAALLLAGPGPYSGELVTFALDDDRSNFTPPTTVLALYGLAQVAVLALLYPWFSRVLARERVWAVVSPAAQRAIGLYLWHIPAVALVAALAWFAGRRPTPLDPEWLTLHLVGIVVVLPLTWVCAGIAARADLAVGLWLRRLRRRRVPTAPFLVAVPVALLVATATGYGTWWGDVFLGVRWSSVLSLAMLAGALVGLAVSRSHDEARAAEPPGPPHSGS
jgi:hypothetical protein